jgi:hypothetical protein
VGSCVDEGIHLEACLLHSMCSLAVSRCSPCGLKEPNKILLSCASMHSECTSSSLLTHTGNVIAHAAQAVAKIPMVSFVVTCQEPWHSFFVALWHLLMPKLLPSRSWLPFASSFFFVSVSWSQSENHSSNPARKSSLLPSP